VLGASFGSALRLLPGVFVLWSCGSPPPCEQPKDFFPGSSVECERLQPIQTEIETLAGRPLTRQQRGELYALLLQERPESVELLASDAQKRDELLKLVVNPAETRSQRIWEAAQNPQGERALWQSKVYTVWATDPEEQLALTESDIEGWIRYASLCREVQGGDALRLSVADRATAYHRLIARFEKGNRAEQVAMVTIGAGWNDLRERWQAAPFEQQQAWISAAPLPPPMTTDSIGYFTAIVDSNPVSHAMALDEVFGRLELSSDAR